MIAVIERLARWDQRLAYAQAHRFTRWTPNQITAASAAVALLAILCLWHGWYAAGAGLFFLQRMMDCWDGEVARITGRVTTMGSVYDHATDLFLVAGSFVALGLSDAGKTWWLGICLAGAVLVAGMHAIAFRCARRVEMPDGRTCMHYFPVKQLADGQAPWQRGLKAGFDLARADWLMIPLALSGLMATWVAVRIAGTVGMCWWLLHRHHRKEVANAQP